MNILLAVPTFENIQPETFKSLWDMDKAAHDVEFDAVRGYDCATARNAIAQMAIDHKTDFVMMVDSDMVVPKDALLNMLEDPVDVCLGYCPRRSDHSLTSIFRLYRKNGKTNTSFSEPYPVSELRDSSDKRIQVIGGGTAIVLIKTDVFRRLPRPWFDWVNDKDGTMVSEDLYFCNRLKNARIPIFVDTRVSCGHNLRTIYW